jgi:hypothetical protein
MYADGIAKMMGAMLMLFLLVGVAVGFVLFVAIPWMWPYVKAWVHAVTG